MNDSNTADIIMDTSTTIRRMNIGRLQHEAINKVLDKLNNELLKKPMEGLLSYHCYMPTNGNFNLFPDYKTSFKIDNRWRAYSCYIQHHKDLAKKQIQEILGKESNNGC